MAFRPSSVVMKKLLMPGVVHEANLIAARHPERVLRRTGDISMGCISIPSNLQTAIRELLAGIPPKELRRDAAEFSEIMNKGYNGWEAAIAAGMPNIVPMPPAYLKAAASVVVELQEKHTRLSAQRKAMERAEKEVRKSLKSVVYDETTSLAYVAARMPSTFSTIYRVFNEINKRLPHIQPTSILDFGSGPATAIWSARELWKDSLQRYTVIEKSGDMVRIGLQLFERVDDPPDLEKYPTIEWASRKLRGEDRLFDVVVAAYSLGEIEDNEERSEVVRRLWGHTRHLLVIIESGNPRGWTITQNARKQILSMSRRSKMKFPEKELDDVGLSMESHVVAPCAHDGVCPMEGTTSWCHFTQRLQRTIIQRIAKRAAKKTINQHEDEKFSYVILQRGRRPIEDSPMVRILEIQKEDEEREKKEKEEKILRKKKKAEEKEKRIREKEEMLKSNFSFTDKSFLENRRWMMLKAKELKKIKEGEFMDRSMEDIGEGKENDSEKEKHYFEFPIHSTAPGVKKEEGLSRGEGKGDGLKGLEEEDEETMDEYESEEDEDDEEDEDVDEEEEEEEEDEEEEEEDELEVKNEKIDDAVVAEEYLRRRKERAMELENVKQRVEVKQNSGEDGGEEEENEGEEDEDGVIISKRKFAKVNSGWSRIVRMPRRRGAHVILDMCSSTSKEGTQGELQRHIITKSCGKVEYRFARRMKWGDLWPVPLN